MPRCEGRPTEACPDRRNDSTVCLTQGDLMLCHACDEFRFPPTRGSRVSKTVRIVTQSNPKGYSASHGTASGITGETKTTLSLAEAAVDENGTRMSFCGQVQEVSTWALHQPVENHLRCSMECPRDRSLGLFCIYCILQTCYSWSEATI